MAHNKTSSEELCFFLSHSPTLIQLNISTHVLLFRKF